jgi:hypothetical protein
MMMDLEKKEIKLINMGEFQGLNTSYSGQMLSLGRHKVFNWTDVESISSPDADAKSRPE